MDNKYENLLPEIQEKIIADFGSDISAEKAIRRDTEHDRASLWRRSYIRDIEKIMNCPYYNRYADKTQVFSFFKNDDISHRSFHVQLVSRIARNIGFLLHLDCELIEAIALGHDIGHTPFGHPGEHFLNDIYFGRTGRYFNHNVQSVRVLDKIFDLNLSLQTLDGILCHNGEIECEKYVPAEIADFTEFDKKYERCLNEKDAISELVPCTIEGCVVRICDIIAYIGKDRQDALKTNIITDDSKFGNSIIGTFNALMINNLSVNIINNSYGKPYIEMDKEHFDALTQSKRDNYAVIYSNEKQSQTYRNTVRPMFEKIYDELLRELKSGDRNSVIFRHHIDYINSYNKFRGNYDYLAENTPDDIVADYIASMTDDYMTDLYTFLFNKPSGAEYISYFNDMH